MRELKARLSHYLRLAEAGERIVVTERGKPSALLVGVKGARADVSPLAIRVLQGVQEGWIQQYDSEIAEEIVYSFDGVFTSRVSMVEVHRNFA